MGWNGLFIQKFYTDVCVSGGNSISCCILHKFFQMEILHGLLCFRVIVMSGDGLYMEILHELLCFRVIAMGGDGLYMEILHGLTLRKQEEEGVDFNDPDATLIPPAVRVGIVPAGRACVSWCLFV